MFTYWSGAINVSDELSFDAQNHNSKWGEGASVV